MRKRSHTNANVLPRYPKSRLPGPAVRLFDFELLLDAQRDEQDTLRVSYDSETISESGGGG